MSKAAAYLWHKPSEIAAWMRRFVVISDCIIKIFKARKDYEAHNNPIYFIKLSANTHLINGTDSVIHQGWLIKKSKIKWNYVRCALVKSGYLRYIDEKQTQKIKSIDFNNAHFILQDNHNVISWSSNNEKHKFRCDSPSIQQKWYRLMLEIQQKCVNVRKQKKDRNLSNDEPTLFTFTIRKPINNNNNFENDENNEKSGSMKQNYNEHYFCAENEHYLEIWKKCATEQIARSDIKDNKEQKISEIDQKMEELMNRLKISQHARPKMFNLNNKQKIEMLNHYNRKKKESISKTTESGRNWSDKLSIYDNVTLLILQQFNVILGNECDKFIAEFIQFSGLNHLCKLTTNGTLKLAEFDFEILNSIKIMIDKNNKRLKNMVIEHEICIKTIVTMLDCEHIKVRELALILLMKMVNIDKNYEISVIASNKILRGLSDLAVSKGYNNKYKILISHMSPNDILNGSFIYDTYTITLINYLIMRLQKINDRMNERALLNQLKFDTILNKLQHRTRRRHSNSSQKSSILSSLSMEIDTYRQVDEADKNTLKIQNMSLNDDENEEKKQDKEDSDKLSKLNRYKSHKIDSNQLRRQRDAAKIYRRSTIYKERSNTWHDNGRNLKNMNNNNKVKDKHFVLKTEIPHINDHEKKVKLFCDIKEEEKEYKKIIFGDVEQHIVNTMGGDDEKKQDKEDSDKLSKLNRYKSYKIGSNQLRRQRHTTKIYHRSAIYKQRSNSWHDNGRNVKNMSNNNNNKRDNDMNKEKDKPHINDDDENEEKVKLFCDIKEEEKEYKQIIFGDVEQHNDESDKDDVIFMDGPTEQFYKFLKENKLEKYFDSFQENECCDIRDIEYFFDDEDLLKNDIGIKSKIHRKKLLGECKKLKIEMDSFKESNFMPSIIMQKLLKFGIVTMNILCNEVENKCDLRDKFHINDDNQLELLWNIIKMQININVDVMSHHQEGNIKITGNQEGLSSI